MTALDDFLAQYDRELDYYQEVARLVAGQVESLLESAGIRAIVTYRAKRRDSLAKKVRARNLERRYDSKESIQDEIVDLAGVRIALYFPGDRSEVEKLLKSQFDLAGTPKEFPTGEPQRTRSGSPDITPLTIDCDSERTACPRRTVATPKLLWRFKLVPY